MSYKYIKPSQTNKQEFIASIKVGNISSLCQAIVDTVHSISDYDWLLEKYICLLDHENIDIRKVTVTCIGHLAQFNEGAVKEQLIKILEPLLEDVEICGIVEDAISDINIFLK